MAGGTANDRSTMGEGPVQSDPALLKALAEASAWIVTLHGPERTAAVERGFQRWLAESPAHRYAFEHATETWSRTRAAVRTSAQLDISIRGDSSERPRRKRRRAVLAIAASLLVAAISVGFHLQRSELSTGIGERRTVVLEDGTQVTLNTATRIAVDYDSQRRHVRLQSGEAFFEVAKRPEWPFVVTAGAREVTALGTSFLVRRDSARTAVTLLEGKVRVTAPDKVAAAEQTSTAAHRSASGAGENSSTTLAPGQRIVFAEHAPPVLDRPEVQKLTAWQQGLVNIDDLTLAEAAEEMNRYSTLQLVVEGAAADIRVSGVFRVTDSENLAQAVALTHGLDMRKEDRRIVLSRTP
jgi:transmembrane sensor